MKMKTIVVTLLLMLAMVLTLSANRVAVHAQSQIIIDDLQDFCDDYAPVTLEGEVSYTVSSYITIEDFAGNAYYYATVSPQGYVITHAATNKTVEASFDADGPFYGVSNDVQKFYAGPGYYFQKVTVDGTQVYLSSTGEIFALDDEELVLMSTDLHSKLTSNQTENDTTQVDQSKTVVLSDGFTYIKDYEYFEQLETDVIEIVPTTTGDVAGYVPIDIYGRCTFAALAVLLGYMDCYMNPNIIPSQFKRTPVDSEYNGTSKNYNNIGLTDMEYLTLIPDSFLDKLTSYIYPDGPNSAGQYPAYSVHLKNAMEDYIEEYLSDCADDFTHVNDVILAFPKQHLKQGRPVVVCIGYAPVNSSSEKIITHSVIAYAYKGGMLKVFDQTDLTVKILNYAIIGSQYTLMYSGEHVHSDNLRFKNNGSFGTYCPCGHKTCTHSSGIFNAAHGCASCGSVYHTLSYPLEMVYTATAHRMYCAECGEYVMVTHNLQMNPSGGFYCLCGYGSSGDGEIALGNPNHDEDN